MLQAMPTRRFTQLQRAILFVSGAVPALGLMWLGTGALVDPLGAGLSITYALAVPLSKGIGLARIMALGQVAAGAAVFAFWGRWRIVGIAAAVIAGLPCAVILSVPVEFDAFTCGCYGSLMGESLARFPLTQIAIGGAMSLLLLGYSIMLPAKKKK